MTIDRGKFYHARDTGVCALVPAFGGRLNQGQVDTMEALLNEWDRLVAAKKVEDILDYPAYVLATDLRECGANMVPVRETFATSDAQARARLSGVWYAKPSPVTGLSYYGRGIVQLTHYSNYLNMTTLINRALAEKDSSLAKLLGSADRIDLTLTPDRALELPVAVWVTFEGMLNDDSHAGDFTGASLETFTKNGKLNFVEARRVVNGTDHAEEIAGNAELFLKALKGASVKGK